MNPIATQQDALDNTLVPFEKRLKIKRCNARIAFTKPQKEETYQFWNTIKKIGKSDAYDFKLDKKKCRVDTEMNVDYVALLWEDFMYQTDNREISLARKEHMPYPGFTKVIIAHFISKDNTISMRNRINLHTSRDDTLKLSKSYKTCLDYATRKIPPKKARKFKKPASPKLKTVPASPKEPTQKDTSDKPVSKKKAPAKTGRGKGIKLLSNAALLEEAQMKKALKKSKLQTHNLQVSSSSEGANFESEVPDEPTGNTKDTNESYDDHDENDNYDEDDNDDDNGNDDDDGIDDDNDYEEEEQDEEYVFSPEKDKSDDEEKMFEEEDDDVAKELYGDLNITQRLRDTNLTNAQQGGEDKLNASHESGFVQEEEDAHVTLTTVHAKIEGPMQISFVSSNFTSKLLNLDDPSLDINSLMNTSTIPPPPPPVNPSSHPTIIPQQQTPNFTSTTYPTMTLPKIPNFASLF
uniref:Uncharacterized protein n=1 Tax=Tanacetum cinerariifolium TaxID=118510 RepID=A0A699J945_TANCI|nr:hypothetical protein [Tanacetum cinerariifolium]